MVPLADQVAAGLHMLEEEQIFARDLLACILSHTILRLLIALNLPIIVYVARSIITEARNFLSLADRRILAL